ncbi:LOW QUALITY PROTEIN: condensin complex subunit 1-like [Haliotis rubra]|uniref:LOW QUALITY PROTEIN: condensin complex subunit 1-like n=1 Tax=Haliotis rubra TaxID=36100 RepID=UPI001EE4ECEF|nr:LOW QUALITY PROTEIN: condensin complex subunit 1-like [Haliotis rubra]
MHRCNCAFTLETNFKMFEFQIPVSRDDLLTKTSVNQYSVEEILTHRLVQGALQDFKYAIRSNSFAVIDNFDSLFSILCLQRDLDAAVKEETWDCLLKATRGVASQVSSVVEETGIDPDTRARNLNLVKMTVYLLCQFIEMFETDFHKANAVQINVTKGRKSQKKRVDSGIDWEREREMGVHALLQIIQLNLPKLWDPPIPEEEFVSLVSNTCYKLLENPGISKVKDTRETISHILGCLVKRYNHGLGASLKVIQLLQHFEHLVSPLSLTVEMFVNHYGLPGKEIGRIDAQDLSRDTSGTRAYSLFLVELAERVPAVMLPNISVLLCHLDGDSYSMRNGVLGVLGEILRRVLSKDGLDDNMKKARDGFFDKLEEHIHDVHAFVRSKVLQIWLTIVNEKCLPLPRQEHLVAKVIGRLQDKSSQVRRYAIQLMTALLKCNPFAAKLPMEKLELNHQKEVEKLAAMKPAEHLPQPIPDDVLQGFEREWLAVEEKLLAALDEDNSQEDTQDEDSQEDISQEDITVASQLTRIYHLLLEGRYLSAVKVLSATQQQWPDLAPRGHNQEGDQTTQTDEDGETSQSEDDQQKEEKDGQEDGHSVDKHEVDPVSETVTQLKEIFLGNKKLAHVSATPVEGEGDAASEVCKQQVLVQYLKDSLTFAKQVQTSVPTICQLLGSKNTSDVFEAIEFFVTGFEFGVTATMLGIRRMLTLVWSKESGVKEAVVAAYKRLYLSPQGGNQRSKALAIVTNLTALTIGATLGDLTSLEGLVVEFIKSGEIGPPVIQMLWERFTLKVPNTTASDSRAALLLLSMAAGYDNFSFLPTRYIPSRRFNQRAEMEMVKSNIEVLIKEGLGPRAEDDFLLAQNACRALVKLGSVKKNRGETAAEPFRLPQSHELFSRLSHLLVSEQTTSLDSTMRVVCESPSTSCLEYPYSVVCGRDILKGWTDQKTRHLCLLLCLAGHVALKQLVHLDVSVFGEVKRRLAVQEERNNRKSSGKKNDASLSKTKDSVMTEQETMEDEMGLAGAAARRMQRVNTFASICEMEIVTGAGLLSEFEPLLVAVCSSPGKYPDLQLQTAASLALAKFMTVSSEFCENHLQLMFTILEKSQSPIIRANTIIALGDLAFRFPNLIEPWTPHLYGRLRDESSQVRKNTLQVLTHLILNDMVKVKGQISELASCIVDHDERIANLAKLFFLELSKKGNAVYNVMPDIISRLSDPDIGVDEENFNTIMKYLFAFIQKDKQCESLVEKICHRFRATRVERQSRDLSFCLSMLSYNEKSIRKLQENFSCYSDKLSDDAVYNCFLTIINKARTFQKQEAKTIVDEIEERIERCRNKGLEEDEIAHKASKASGAAASQKSKHKTPAKTPGRRRRNTGKENREFDDSPTPQKRQLKKKTKGKPKLSFSSDEESDVELFSVKDGGDGSEAEDDIDDTFSAKSPVNKRSKGGKVKLTPRQRGMRVLNTSE